MQVLVIEDERRLARLMRRILEDECYVVDVALDGEAGIKKAGSGTYASSCWISCCLVGTELRYVAG